MWTASVQKKKTKPKEKRRTVVKDIIGRGIVGSVHACEQRERTALVSQPDNDSLID